MSIHKIKHLDICSKFPLTSPKKAGDAGYDLLADIEKPIQFRFGSVFVPTKTSVQVLPQFHNNSDEAEYGRDYHIAPAVRPRSGLMKNHGIIAGYGTVDAGYTGEIGVILFRPFSLKNLVKPYIIKPGDAVAQLVFELRFTPPVLVHSETFTERTDYWQQKGTVRGDSGFGSTGR